MKREIAYGSRTLTYRLLRGPRRTIGISVEPRGEVTVAAPQNADVAVVDSAVRRRARWITEKRWELSRYADRLTLPALTAGATHRYLGRSYRLALKSDLVWTVHLRPGVLEVRGPHPSNAVAIQDALDEWLKSRARKLFELRLEAVVPLFRSGARVRPNELVVQRMSHRWGSMSPRGRLTLNLRLLEHPTSCIDYVIAHELAHRLVPNHSRRFWRLLDRVMPDWPTRRRRLEIQR
jgi:hypothetical protein